MEKLSDLLSMNGEREAKEIQKKQCRIYTIVYRESKRFITQIKQNAILDDSSDETCNTISQIQKEIWKSMVRSTKP